MLYPLPAVMVTCRGKDGKDNIITIGWTGTVCSDPAMTYVSVRKERYSHAMILETGEFVINLTTKKLAKATDFCGVRSGRDVDKFEAMHLTKEEAQVVNVPMIAESPVNIKCRVTEVKELGSHDMFLAEVVAVHAAEAYMDEKGRFSLTAADPIAYSHGTYFTLGEQLGTFGYSVKKGKTGKSGVKSGSKRPTAKKSSGKNSEKDK